MSITLMPIRKLNKMELSRTRILLFVLLFHHIAFHSAIASTYDKYCEYNIARSDFPDGFLFGTSTSSYQVEGAYKDDGKGPNNWDVFTHIPGNIENNDNGDVADNHYYRYLEDIDIMHSLGVNAYRFSISWARILPRGRFGEVNPDGISFYNNLIDNLLLKGIEPFVTINHHDIPHELEDRYGAWLSPLTQDDFVYFAEICFTNFGDRIKYWTTVNEPNLYIDMGYIRGWYPPARCSPPFGNCSKGNSDEEPLIAMHNLLLSHAKAVKLYRHQFQKKQGGFIGIIANTVMYEPLRDNDLDREAVRRALAFNVAWMLDPLIYGDYPPEMRIYLGKKLPRFTPQERECVKGSIDFVGINHYSSLYAKDCIYSACALGGDRPIRGFVNTTGERDGIPIGERTGMPRFFIVPRGMEKIIDYVKHRYKNMPMFVTENGYTPPMQQNQQEQDLLNDGKRIEFHKSYLAALARAIRKGADVRGYFVWSLMDNFEWLEGYTKRFGLVYVDRRNLTRKPKLSAIWFKSFLQNSTFNDAINHMRSLEIFGKKKVPLDVMDAEVVGS